MAERAPPDQPPSDRDCSSISEIHEHSIVPAHPVYESGTYVVQVPKDQIYRVPPPENALIAERRKKPENDKSKSSGSCCCSCFCWCFILVALLVVIAGVSVGISFVVLKPNNPEFRVQHVVAKNSTPLEFDIKLSVHNPNARSSISYKDGVTSLSFGQQKIARGKFPALYQDHKDSTQIGLVLKGLSSIKLPEEVQNSMKYMKSKIYLTLSLKVNVPVRMKTSSFKTGNTNIVVMCDFSVDTLAKGSRVVSQECQTDR